MWPDNFLMMVSASLATLCRVSAMATIKWRAMSISGKRYFPRNFTTFVLPRSKSSALTGVSPDTLFQLFSLSPAGTRLEMGSVDLMLGCEP